MMLEASKSNKSGVLVTTALKNNWPDQKTNIHILVNGADDVTAGMSCKIMSISLRLAIRPTETNYKVFAKY